MYCICVAEKLGNIHFGIIEVAPLARGLVARALVVRGLVAGVGMSACGPGNIPKPWPEPRLLKPLPIAGCGWPVIPAVSDGLLVYGT